MSIYLLLLVLPIWYFFRRLMNATLIQYHGQTTTSKALPLCPPIPDWTFPTTYIACNRYSQLPFCGSSPVEKTNASQGSGQYTHVSECFGAFIFSSLDEKGQDLWWLPFYMGWKGENFAKLPNLHGIISLFDAWFRISPFIYNLRQTMKWPRKGYMRIPHHGVRRTSSWVCVLPQIWATYLHIIFWSKNGPKKQYTYQLMMRFDQTIPLFHHWFQKKIRLSIRIASLFLNMWKDGQKMDKGMWTSEMGLTNYSIWQTTKWNSGSAVHTSGAENVMYGLFLPSSRRYPEGLMELWCLSFQRDYRSTYSQTLYDITTESKS